MSRLSPKKDVLRALFARSGNQCAFPGCTQLLINDKGQFIAQVCHIEAASEGGERYNRDGNNEQRRSYKNLLILCYPHHIETNDVEEYSVERLLQIKKTHENQFIKSNFKLNEAELYKISYEMEQYWSEIERLNSLEHIFYHSGLVMEIKKDISFLDLIENVFNTVMVIEKYLKLLHESDESLMSDIEIFLKNKGISEEVFQDIPYYENIFIDRNWELHNIGSPNSIQRLKIDLMHMKVMYLEEYMKMHNDDFQARENFEKTKEALKQYAMTAMHVD